MEVKERHFAVRQRIVAEAATAQQRAQKQRAEQDTAAARAETARQLTRAQQAEQESAAAKAESTRQQTRAQQAEQQAAAAKAEATRQHARAQQLEQEAAAAKAESAKQLAKAQQETATARAESAQHHARAKRAEQDIAATKAENSRLHAQLQQSERQSTAANSEIAAYRRAQGELTLEAERLRGEIARWRRQALALRRAAAEDDTRIEAIETQTTQRAERIEKILEAPFWWLLRKAYFDRVPFLRALSARFRLLSVSHSGDDLALSIRDGTLAQNWAEIAALRSPTTLRTEIHSALAELKVGTLLEIGCGHCSWLGAAAPTAFRYTGLDVHEQLTLRNRRVFGNRVCTFETIDAACAALPASGAVLCNNWFEYLTLNEVDATLRRIRASGARYLIASNHESLATNVEANAGQWRPLNLMRQPFDLPAPLQRLCADAQSGAALGIWRLSTAANASADEEGGRQ